MYYRIFLASFFIALSLHAKAAQPIGTPLLLFNALSESIPEIEAVFYSLEPNMPKEVAEALLGRASEIKPAAKIRGGLLEIIQDHIFDDKWSFPEGIKCTVMTYSKRSGSINIKCYFDEKNRLVWKAAILSRVVPNHMSSEPEVKRSLQWVFTHQDSSDFREVKIIRPLLRYYSFGDIPEVFEKTEQREILEKLKSWAFSESKYPYQVIFRDIAMKMRNKLSVDNNPLGADYAEIYYRVTGDPAFAFWELRSKTKRKAILDLDTLFPSPSTR